MTVVDMNVHSASGTRFESVKSGRLEWTSACPLSQLIPGLGVAVLLRGGEQVALFLLEDGSCTPSATSTVRARGRDVPRPRG